ncbi:hypothetical protein C2I36_00575 [Rhodobacteraceae bacterium WD3A24]|nr:hypothetical protein C2I36_00575 [Rhodobacteraceae bacterium WD3A24]
MGSISRPPKTRDDAIRSDDTIKRFAELYLFGEWLLLDGASGLKATPGKAPDKTIILKTVAAAAAEIFRRDQPQKEGLPAPMDHDKGKITATDLSKRWKELFDDEVSASDFRGRIKTVARVLPAYFDHLRSGVATGKGTKRLKSPTLRKALDAMTGKVKVPHAASPVLSGSSSTSRSHASTPAAHVVSTGHGFSIALGYSTTRKMHEYRRAATPLPAASLSYAVGPLNSPQARMKDRLIFMPEVAIKENYEAKALIDRVIVLVDTNARTHFQRVRDAADIAGRTRSFVHDLAVRAGNEGWRARLPHAAHASSGHQFAILLQEPTPKMIAAILEKIDREWEIVGDARLFLLEFSIDFHPARDRAPEERLALREQMVGLLQRHHWLDRSNKLKVDDDARQVYVQPATAAPKASAQFLFAQPGKVPRLVPDHELRHEHARNRIAHGKHVNTLYLDATLYRGAQPNGLRISTQHKITDQVNPETGTRKELPDDERRARIEVEISGEERLKEHGLARIEDLSTNSIRKLKTRYLSFWLPTSPADRAAEKVVRDQLTWRGVYGVDLTERLQEEDAYLEAKAAGYKNLRRPKGTTGTLCAWEELNKVVGRATDTLARRWSQFSWKKR